MPHPRPVVLVTGAARRIGAAIAQRLHAQGHDLALHCHGSLARMEELAASLEAIRPDSVLVLQADLQAVDAPALLVQRCIARYGRIDGLVNNASSFFATPLGQANATQWDALFAVNARAPFFLAQAAAPHLRQAGGAIVNLADLYAGTPLRGHPLYSAAKAALVSLTRGLAQALAPEVRVNAVAPGAILWPEQVQDAAAREAILRDTALGRTGTPEDIAAAVAWLLSGEAAYVTGQVLHVDGGRTR
ncbi:pteridine reductase [Pseudoxanthomonas suwonensis]